MAVHKLTEGESFARVAELYDYNNWKTLWDENTDLQGKRNNPNILFHGVRNREDPATYLHEPDSIEWTPEAERQEAVQTSTHASFGAVTDQLWLRFRVVNPEFEPFADATYALDIGGRVIAPETLVPDGDGVISVKINPSDVNAKLIVTYQPQTDGGSAETEGAAPPEPVSVEFMMQVGRLDPIKDLAPAPDDKFTPGVQQRLNNLGFGAGSVTGVSNATTESAIRRFQKLCNITEESAGKPISGPQTQDWLEKLHDKPGRPPERTEEAPESTSTGGAAAETTTTPASTGGGPPPRAVNEVALAAAKQRYEQALRSWLRAKNQKDAAFEKWRKTKSRNDFAEYDTAKKREAMTQDEVDRARRDVERAKRGR